MQSFVEIPSPGKEISWRHMR